MFVFEKIEKKEENKDIVEILEWITYWHASITAFFIVSSCDHISVNKRRIPFSRPLTPACFAITKNSMASITSDIVFDESIDWKSFIAVWICNIKEDVSNR